MATVVSRLCRPACGAIIEVVLVVIILVVVAAAVDQILTWWSSPWTSSCRAMPPSLLQSLPPPSVCASVAPLPSPPAPLPTAPPPRLCASAAATAVPSYGAGALRLQPVPVRELSALTQGPLHEALQSTWSFEENACNVPGRLLQPVSVVNEGIKEEYGTASRPR
eukprot:CAMPEP_0206047494 /NCGR_PEP_ID=MMETSP1466-20131121/21325_1 /ASSEMBLY_ACC=CAM_ASM_001126 /TAXON_ID=44452 /ORGANISM="Pavlova gyrans, Strain CCMP608" /LENGTH=164 /DNA_ID=CAMNT_0053422509 /DNA_START=382 /DNA_END=873 /DNA_ORIENTATION=-